MGRASARRATGLTRGRWASGALMVYSLLTMARVEVRQCLTVISLRAQGRGRAGVCRARPTGARFIAALRDGERVERACAAAMISSSFAFPYKSCSLKLSLGPCIPILQPMLSRGKFMKMFHTKSSILVCIKLRYPCNFNICNLMRRNSS